eukprot:7669886-Alexandrium_andersonii.AAC.1
MHNAASGGFVPARNCPEQFRALAGAFGRFRTLSGSFWLRPKAPESARKRPKLLRAVQGSMERA